MWKESKMDMKHEALEGVKTQHYFFLFGEMSSKGNLWYIHDGMNMT